MAVGHELGNSGRGDSHPELVVLDFLRDADDHALLLADPGVARGFMVDKSELNFLARSWAFYG
ncbi:hypothetical protein GCM10023166_14000 [Paeniglutamicibacter cryotolerans]